MGLCLYSTNEIRMFLTTRDLFNNLIWQFVTFENSRVNSNFALRALLYQMCDGTTTNYLSEV